MSRAADLPDVAGQAAKPAADGWSLEQDRERFGTSSISRDLAKETAWLAHRHPALAAAQTTLAGTAARMFATTSWFTSLCDLADLPPIAPRDGHRIEGATHQVSGRVGLRGEHLAVLNDAFAGRLRDATPAQAEAVVEAAATLLHEMIHLLGGRTREERLLILQAAVDGDDAEHRISEGLTELATVQALPEWAMRVGLARHVPALTVSAYQPKYVTERSSVLLLAALGLPRATPAALGRLVATAVADGGGSNGVRRALAAEISGRSRAANPTAARPAVGQRAL